jgi:CBS domain-containing protein
VGLVCVPTQRVSRVAVVDNLRDLTVQGVVTLTSSLRTIHANPKGLGSLAPVPVGTLFHLSHDAVFALPATASARFVFQSLLDHGYYGCALIADSGACVGSASLWDVVTLTRDGLSAEQAEVLLDEPIDRFLLRLPPTSGTPTTTPRVSGGEGSGASSGPGASGPGAAPASSVPLGDAAVAALAPPVGGAPFVEPSDSLLTVIELLAVCNVHRVYIVDPVSRAPLGVVTIPDVLRMLLAPAVVVPTGALDTPLVEAALPVGPAGPDHPLTALLSHTTVEGLLASHGTPFGDIKDIGEDASMAQVLDLLNGSKVCALPCSSCNVRAHGSRSPCGCQRWRCQDRGQHLMALQVVEG